MAELTREDRLSIAQNWLASLDGVYKVIMTEYIALAQRGLDQENDQENRAEAPSFEQVWHEEKFGIPAAPPGALPEEPAQIPFNLRTPESGEWQRYAYSLRLQLTLTTFDAEQRLKALTACEDELRAMQQRADKAEAEAREMREKAARWEWARDMLSGDNGSVANAKALFIAAGLMRNETIDQIIDGALAAARTEKGKT